MAFSRQDVTSEANVPQLGKSETSYPTPNKADRVVIERVPIAPSNYEPLPPHSPHPTYETTGLFLVWQGKVKAENNQIAVVRVYANDEVENSDWYNASIKYSGDVVAVPVFMRSYVELRENYTAGVKGSSLSRAVRLRVLTGGVYTSAPTVTITPAGPGVAPTARAIMNPAQTRVIALEQLTPGSGLVTNPTIAFSGGGQTTAATATAEIQPAAAFLVREETSKLDSEDSKMASLFIKVTRFYEVLPGPWLPETRYDDNLGPIQMYRRANLNTGQIGGTITPTYKTNYASRDGSAIVIWEIIEAWSNGTGVPGPFPAPFPGPGPFPGTNPNPLYPVLILDDYDRNQRGAYERKSQIVVATGSEAGSLTRLAGVLTKISYEPYSDNPFLLKKIIETWVEVVIHDKRMFEGFGGAIISHDETTDQPGAQVNQVGLLVVKSELETKSPNEQTLTVEMFDPSSAVPTLELTFGGRGYPAPTAPPVTFNGGTGSGASATAVLGFGLASVGVDAGGSEFMFPPNVSATGGGGGGAFLLAVLGFGVDRVAMSNRGGGYNTAPTAAITGGGGTGAVLVVVMGWGVYFATITNPGGRASGTLTGTSTNPANDDQVTIAGLVYTFKTTLTAAVRDVLRGASTDASLLNLINAINHTGTPGTDYVGTTANPYVFADPAVAASHKVNVTSIQPGEFGNAYGTSEASTQLSWGAPTLTGGFNYTEIPRAIIHSDGYGDGALSNLIMGHPVRSIPLSSNGTGYLTTPIVAVLFGSGSGLIAAAVLNKWVDRIDVDAPGTYDAPPLILIGPPLPGGVQALAHSVLTGPLLTSIVIDERGDGYEDAPPVAVVDIDSLIVTSEFTIVTGDDGEPVTTT